jgi:hypothetical protein
MWGGSTIRPATEISRSGRGRFLFHSIEFYKLQHSYRTKIVVAFGFPAQLLSRAIETTYPFEFILARRIRPSFPFPLPRGPTEMRA